MTYRLSALVCAALLATGFPTMAADAVMRSDAILAQQHAIRTGMDAKTERYANMPRAARKAILEDQQKLEKLLEGKEDTSQLAPADQTEVRRLVARIDAAVRNNEVERMVCTQEARTGSNYVTRVCRTPEQIRQQKEKSEKLLKDEASRIKCTDANGCV